MFKYGDNVRIKGGFYKDCIGTLEEFILLDDAGINEYILYEVSLSLTNSRNCRSYKIVKFKESEIEKIEETK